MGRVLCRKGLHWLEAMPTTFHLLKDHQYLGALHWRSLQRSMPMALQTTCGPLPITRGVVTALSGSTLSGSTDEAANAAALLERALAIMGEWACAMRISDEDVESERAVILEEWRSRQGPGQRMLQRYWQRWW